MEEHDRIAARGNADIAWPPEFDEENKRARGFFNRVIYRWSEYNPCLEMLHDLAKRNQATRITARFVVAHGSGIDGSVEARIQLSGRWEGHDFIYFGLNSEGRKNTKDAIDQQKRRILWINDPANVRPVTKEYALIRTAESLAEVGFIEGRVSDEDLQNLAALYEKAYAGYTPLPTESGIRKIVENPGNLVCVARDKRDRRIRSIGIAERHSREIGTINGSKELKFAEIKDAARNNAK